MIRVLLVDDEPLALRQLERYVEKIPFLECVASCPSAAAARPYVAAADILYVDIEMPDFSGIDFVRSLGDQAPLVVFTTAYSEYALEGFRVHAADYLLKPIRFQDFEASASLLRDRILQGRPPVEEVLSFRTEHRTVRVEVSRIRYVESMSEYLKIHLDGDAAPLVVLYSLKRLAEQLPRDRFLRIHRSYLVNLSQVREYARGTVLLSGGPTLPVGDLYRADLKAILARTSGK